MENQNQNQKIDGEETKTTSEAINQKSKLQLQLEAITKKIAQKEARAITKENVIKQRELKKSRAERNRHIYKVGGMVEKMGLVDIDEKLLLGLLAYANNKLKLATEERKNQWIEKGTEFLPVGKKMTSP